MSSRYTSLSQLRGMAFDEIRQNMISGNDTLLPRINARREALHRLRFTPISTNQIPFFIHNSRDDTRESGSDEGTYEEYLELDERNVQRGVPQSVLSRLPVTRANTSQCSSKCAICQDDITKGKSIMKLPCQHIYCVDCILQWFKQSKNCPTCRAEVM